jgi:hypothetical protein
MTDLCSQLLAYGFLLLKSETTILVHFTTKVGCHCLRQHIH